MYFKWAFRLIRQAWLKTLYTCISIFIHDAIFLILELSDVSKRYHVIYVNQTMKLRHKHINHYVSANNLFRSAECLFNYFKMAFVFEKWHFIKLYRERIVLVWSNRCCIYLIYKKYLLYRHFSIPNSCIWFWCYIGYSQRILSNA